MTIIKRMKRGRHKQPRINRKLENWLHHKFSKFHANHIKNIHMQTSTLAKKEENIIFRAIYRPKNYHDTV